MRNYLSILIYIFIFFILFSLWGFYLAIRPFKITSHLTPKDFGVAYENVSFRTEDNVLIKGWFIPNKNPRAKTIILLHGYPADKGNILPSRIFLHRDYQLLFMDFRYFGESSGHYSTIGKNEVLDLLAAIDFLKTRGIHEVGVWGFSLGGAVALMAATKTPAIKAIVAESSYARLDWMNADYYPIPLLRYPLAELTRFWAWLFLHYSIASISPALSAKSLTIPILIIHSKNDNMIAFKHGLLLQQALKNNNTAIIKWTETKHGEPFPHYEETIQTFFDKNFKKPAE